MKDKKKRQSRLRKVLRGVFKTQDEEVKSYFDSGINLPDEYDLVEYFIRGYGQRPIDQEDSQSILYDCLRELYPEDYTNEQIGAKVKEFLDYGFVERWNGGYYW